MEGALEFRLLHMESPTRTWECPTISPSEMDRSLSAQVVKAESIGAAGFAIQAPGGIKR